MLVVYFKNCVGKGRVIGSAETENESRQVIMKFLDYNNYKAPYWRSWTEENGDTWYDVGSHTEFFFVREEN